MNKKITFLYFVLSILLLITLVSAQEAGGGGEPSPLPSGGSGGVAANYTVEYNPEILEAFKNQTWLPVLVRLKDNSNITLTGTKEEQRLLSIQRDEWFKPVVEEFYASLSKNDFRGERGGSSLGFVGFITKNGFESLLNDSRVKSISWTKYDVYATFENGSIPNKNKSIVENNTIKELESKIPTNLSKYLVIEEKENQDLLWLWTTMIFILIILFLYLIIKIKKR